jgi:twitching motility two-component system response regulator PilH
MKNIEKILLVDDDIDIINSIKPVLEHKGFEVIFAHNKKDGYALAINEKPDLAILDVMMDTQHEGFELAYEIRTNPELNDMKVAMHTSIDVFTTTNPSIQDMAREIRKDPTNKDLRVVLIKNVNKGTAGIDYFTEDSRNVFINVDDFLPKPMDISKIMKAIEEIKNR